MRPPYGAHNETVDKNAGAPVILWSKDSTDWRLKNADAIYEKTLSEVEDGDIILLHDIHDFSVSAKISTSAMAVPSGWPAYDMLSPDYRYTRKRYGKNQPEFDKQLVCF